MPDWTIARRRLKNKLIKKNVNLIHLYYHLKNTLPFVYKCNKTLQFEEKY